MSISAASARRGTPVTVDTPARRRDAIPSRPNENNMRAATVTPPRPAPRALSTAPRSSKAARGVPTYRLAKSPSGAWEWRKANTPAAPAPNPSDWAVTQGDVEDRAECHSGHDGPRNGAGRRERLFTQGARRFKAGEREKPRGCGQCERRHADAGWQHEDRAGEVLPAGRGAGRKPPVDHAHEHEDEADGHDLEQQHRPGGRPDPADRKHPDDRPGGERGRVPVRVGG